MSCDFILLFHAQYAPINTHFREIAQLREQHLNCFEENVFCFCFVCSFGHSSVHLNPSIVILIPFFFYFHVTQVKGGKGDLSNKVMRTLSAQILERLVIMNGESTVQVTFPISQVAIIIDSCLQGKGAVFVAAMRITPYMMGLHHWCVCGSCFLKHYILWASGRCDITYFLFDFSSLKFSALITIAILFTSCFHHIVHPC